MLLPRHDVLISRQVAGRLRSSVRQAANKGQNSITVSIGGACTDTPRPLRDMLHAADISLYAVKHAGRDGVEVQNC